MTETSAVHSALRAYRQPSRLRMWRYLELPQDYLDLIKISAGDHETIEALMNRYNVNEDELRSAAVFVLNYVISRAGGDNFRILGLPKYAGREDIRIHKRWLLKWLHPDRNHNAWESVLFRKVSDAAKGVEDAKFPEPQNGNVAYAEKIVGNSSDQRNNSAIAAKHRRSGAFRAFAETGTNHFRGRVRTTHFGWLFKRALRRFVLALSIVAVIAALVTLARYFFPSATDDFGLVSGLDW
jgi:hypothetical protein